MPAAGDGFRRNAGSRPAMIGAGGAGGTRSQSGKRRGAGISAGGRRMRRDWAETIAGGMLPMRIFAGAGLFPLAPVSHILNGFAYGI